MANRSLRRTYKPTESTAIVISEPVREYEHSTILESGTEQTVDTEPVRNDPEPVTNSEPVERNRVSEFDPSDYDSVRVGTGTESSSGDGKRGRKPRSDSGKQRGRKATKGSPQNVEALVGMVHTWASVILKTPELMLAPDEVKQLSAAYEQFTEYHEVPLLTPKRMSEINLISTALFMYGTRLVAIKNRKTTERNARKMHVMQGGQRAAN